MKGTVWPRGRAECVFVCVGMGRDLCVCIPWCRRMVHVLFVYLLSVFVCLCVCVFVRVCVCVFTALAGTLARCVCARHEPQRSDAGAWAGLAKPLGLVYVCREEKVDRDVQVSNSSPQHTASLLYSCCGCWRQVFLLTDGEVSDTEAVVRLCRQQHSATGARVFSFGIGADVSHALVHGAASAGGWFQGAHLLWTPGQRYFSPSTSRRPSAAATTIAAPALTWSSSACAGLCVLGVCVVGWLVGGWVGAGMLQAVAPRS